jgi:multiple sugar transport system permease protein
MMAASVVASIPVAGMFVFMQRYFIAGLTAGAVKG